MLAIKKINTEFFTRAAIWSTAATCLVIPFATALLSLFSTLVFVFWLFSGKIREIPRLCKENIICSVSLSLFILFIIGILYSSAPFDYAFEYLKKYRELLFIPIVISLLQGQPESRKRCENWFIYGCIILLIISYAMFFSLIPVARYGYSVVYHITHSYFMSVLAFVACHKILDSRRFRYFWLIIFIATIINLFYISTGRTGMLIFPFLMILFVIQRLSPLQQMIGLFILTLLLSISFTTSENFSSRCISAIKEVQNYEYGASRTSLGQRFDWWKNSVTLIKEKPLFGHGSGAFTGEHDRLISNTKMQPTDNPHNEYLLIGVQLGLVGVSIFILLFSAQFFCSFQLEKQEKLFAQGVIVAMAIGCTMNSFLFDTHQGHFYAFLSAVYFSSNQKFRLPFHENSSIPM